MAELLHKRGSSIAASVLIVLSIIAALGSQLQIAHAGTGGTCKSNCSCYGGSTGAYCRAVNCGSGCTACQNTVCNGSQNPPPGD